MKKNIVRKGLVLGMIVLFMGIIIPSHGFPLDNKTVIPTSRGNIFYVGEWA